MKLAIRPLSDVGGVNDFVYATKIEGTRGDSFDFYFQLVDIGTFLERQNFSPPGLRYIPGDGSILTLEVWNVDKEKRFTRVAINPFPQDTSIFHVTFLSTDPLDCSVNFRAVLLDACTSPATQRTCHVQGALTLRDG
jgi:hypothetical protein